MSNARIALSLAPAVLAVALVGCKSEPATVHDVPPPSYAAEPEPLPPVVIDQGSATRVGPTAGLGPTTEYTPEPLPPVEPTQRSYTIKKNDTFWKIAQREYGNGQRWVDIAQANPSLDPKKLAVGTKIVLP